MEFRQLADEILPVVDDDDRTDTAGPHVVDRHIRRVVCTDHDRGAGVQTGEVDEGETVAARVEPEGMAAMYAYRKQFKRSQTKGAPESHAGLGLDLYAQATSPLRRYQDLVAHQQLRAFLRGEPVLANDQVLARAASTDVLIGNVRQGERLSNRHWTLVHLQRHPDWQGEGVIVEKRNRRATVLIPELGLDAQIQASGDPPLDAVVLLRCTRVNLPEQIANFQITERA